MIVKKSYIKDSYLYFELDNSDTKSYPYYWAFSPFLGANEHIELQSLLSQIIKEEYFCQYCKSSFNGIPILDFICSLCQIDREIINLFESTK